MSINLLFLKRKDQVIFGLRNPILRLNIFLLGFFNQICLAQNCKLKMVTLRLSSEFWHRINGNLMIYTSLWSGLHITCPCHISGVLVCLWTYAVGCFFWCHENKGNDIHIFTRLSPSFTLLLDITVHYLFSLFIHTFKTVKDQIYIYSSNIYNRFSCIVNISIYNIVSKGGDNYL